MYQQQTTFIHFILTKYITLFTDIMASDNLSSPGTNDDQPRDPVLALLQGHPQTSACAQEIFAILTGSLVHTVEEFKCYARKECKDVPGLGSFLFEQMFRFATDYPEQQQRAMALKLSVMLWETFREPSNDVIQQSNASTTFNIKRTQTTFQVTIPSTIENQEATTIEILKVVDPVVRERVNAILDQENTSIRSEEDLHKAVEIEKNKLAKEASCKIGRNFDCVYKAVLNKYTNNAQTFAAAQETMSHQPSLEELEKPKASDPPLEKDKGEFLQVSY